MTLTEYCSGGSVDGLYCKYPITVLDKMNPIPPYVALPPEPSMPVFPPLPLPLPHSSGIFASILTSHEFAQHPHHAVPHPHLTPHRLFFHGCSSQSSAVPDCKDAGRGARLHAWPWDYASGLEGCQPPTDSGVTTMVRVRVTEVKYVVL